MHKSQQDVREFHRAFGNHTSPAEPAIRDAHLRAKLILEEAFETVVALVGTESAYDLLDCTKSAKYVAEPNFVEVIDGLCDLKYVVEGTFECLGIDGEPFWDEVHASNMTKVFKSSFRSDGKILKGPNFRPPDIAGILERVRGKK